MVILIICPISSVNVLRSYIHDKSILSLTHALLDYRSSSTRHALSVIKHLVQTIY